MRVEIFWAKQILFLILFVFLLCPCAWANSLDYYQSLLLKKNFYLSYEEVMPQTEQINNVLFSDTNFLKNRSMDFLANKRADVIVVENGNNRYEEIGSRQGSLCRLQNGLKIYNFIKLSNSGNVVYYGRKKGKVEEEKYNQLAELEYGRSYGTENMSIVLNAILQNSRKPVKSLDFREIGSGKNKNNMNYIDYRADSRNDRYFIRYCFEHNKLVEILYAKYHMDSVGQFNGTRNILKIKEFTYGAKPKYLCLPEGLKIEESKRRE